MKVQRPHLGRLEIGVESVVECVVGDSRGGQKLVHVGEENIVGVGSTPKQEEDKYRSGRGGQRKGRKQLEKGEKGARDSSTSVKRM